MPIYAYRCEDCGFAKDVLQKMSDDPLSDCPGCGKASFKKQVTAAGFQLKGSGWYVTDFRGGSNGAAGTSSAPAVGAAGPETTASGSASGDAANSTSTASAASTTSAVSGGTEGKAA
ncbi:MAG: FmdB family zinc ribbon protein [Pseudomonadota bacterium]